MLRGCSEAYVFAGSCGLEVSVEGDQWENDLCTRVIRKGIRAIAANMDGDGRVTVSEMMRYSESDVFRLSDGRQSPGARSINAECN